MADASLRPHSNIAEIVAWRLVQHGAPQSLSAGGIGEPETLCEDHLVPGLVAALLRLVLERGHQDFARWQPAQALHDAFDLDLGPAAGGVQAVATAPVQSGQLASSGEPGVRHQKTGASSAAS